MQTWSLTGPVRLREKYNSTSCKCASQISPLLCHVHSADVQDPVAKVECAHPQLNSVDEGVADAGGADGQQLEHPALLPPDETVAAVALGYKKIRISFPLSCSKNDTFFARVSVVEVVVLFELLCREECRLLVVREPQRLGHHQLHHNRVEITCFTVGTNCSFSYSMKSL